MDLPLPPRPLAGRTQTQPYRNTNKMWYLWGDNNKHDTMRRERENDTTHIGCGSGPNPKHSLRPHPTPTNKEESFMITGEDSSHTLLLHISSIY